MKLHLIFINIPLTGCLEWTLNYSVGSEEKDAVAIGKLLPIL